MTHCGRVSPHRVAAQHIALQRSTSRSLWEAIATLRDACAAARRWLGGVRGGGWRRPTFCWTLSLVMRTERNVASSGLSRMLPKMRNSVCGCNTICCPVRTNRHSKNTAQLRLSAQQQPKPKVGAKVRAGAAHLDHDKPLVFRALLAVDSVEQIGAVGAAEVEHCGRRSAKPSEVRIRRQRQNLACHSVQHTNQSTTRSARSIGATPVGSAALRSTVEDRRLFREADRLEQRRAAAKRADLQPSLRRLSIRHRLPVHAARCAVHGARCVVNAAFAACYIMCCALYGA